jgi:FkbM family methyltransferase
MAASMGCNVVAWEPVPNYAAFFKYALIRNHFLSKVQLRQRIVDDKGRGLKTIMVPGSGHLRTAGVGDKTILHAQYHNVTKLKAISEKIDRVVKPQNILIMKIDVQGLESAVLKGSKTLLLDGNVQVRMLITEGILNTGSLMV